MVPEDSAAPSGQGGLLKRPASARGAALHDDAEQQRSRRPIKHVNNASSLHMQQPYPAAITNTVAASYGGGHGADDGSGDEEEQDQHVDPPGSEQEYHTAGNGLEEHAGDQLGQRETGEGAVPAAELTDTVAAGIIAMSNRRAVLLEKIDMLTGAGLQGIDQLKADFKAEMSRMRAQVQECTDQQEQAWHQLSVETRAAEDRLRCARGLVETLNAQGLNSM